MRNRGLLLALLAGLGITLAAVSSRPAAANDDDRIAKMVEDLGSKKFAVRDKARRDLEALGAPALEHLRKAAASKDLETSKRASEILARLEEKATLDSLLAPKKVKLSLKDVSVLKAIEELNRQSGYHIEVQGDRTKLAERKVTIETGEVPFWKAFDQLCAKAGLVHLTNPNVGNPYGDPAIDLPIQIQPAPIQIRPIQIQPKAKVLPAPAPKAQPAPAPAPAGRERPAAPPANAPAVQPVPPAQGNAAIEIQVDVGGAAPVRIPVAVPAQDVAPAQPPMPANPAEQPMQAPAGAAGGAAGGGVIIINNNGAQQVIQIQAQPAQIQPGVIGRPTPPRQAVVGQINVTDGKPQEYPTYYAGAIRIRVLPASAQPQVQPGRPINPRIQPQPAILPPDQPVQPGARPAEAKRDEVTLVLEVTPEPRLQQNFAILGTVVGNAVDDQGQKLAVPMDPMGGQAGVDPNGVIINGGGAVIINNGRVIGGYNPYGQNVAYVRLKLGEKQAKTLKELNGHLTVQMLTAPQAIVAVDDVMKAAGKKVEGKNGGVIEMISATKKNNGQIEVKFRLQQPQNVILQNPFQGQPLPGAMPGGAGGGAQPAIQPAVQPIQGGRALPRTVNAHGLPVLVDAKGKEFQLAQNPTRVYRAAFGGVAQQEVTMVFAPGEGMGEPSRLVLNGQRPIQVPVPFSFENVPLPQNR